MFFIFEQIFHANIRYNIFQKLKTDEVMERNCLLQADLLGKSIHIFHF